MSFGFRYNRTWAVATWMSRSVELSVVALISEPSRLANRLRYPAWRIPYTAGSTVYNTVMCTHSSFFEQRRQFTIHDLLGLSGAQLPAIFVGKSRIVRYVFIEGLAVVLKPRRHSWF